MSFVKIYNGKLVASTGYTLNVGADEVFNTAASNHISATTMDSTHAIVCYRDGGNSDYGTAVCLTLSGTTVTASSEVVFNSAYTLYLSATAMDSTHAIVCYKDDGNSNYGTAVCLTLSGTTITASSEVVFNAGTSSHTYSAMMDSTHAITCYKDEGNSNYGTANCIYIT